MNAARDTRECLRLERWITAYIDDELDAVHVLEVETHLDACECCREQTALSRAVRSSLKRCVAKDAGAKAPSALRERICAAMIAERKHQEAAPAKSAAAKGPEGSDVPARADEDEGVAGGWLAQASGLGGARAGGEAAAPRLVRLRYVMPLAAVATVALLIGSYQLREQKERAVAVQQANTTSSVSVSPFDKFIDDLVEAHMQPPPPEVTDYDGLDRFNPYVGVRVPRPKLTAIGARYLGARMHRRDAAMLQYSLGDRQRVTLYVFDPTRVPVQANRLQPRIVGNNHVYVGRVRGYAVAASEHDGVGYALASDLDDRDTERVLVMAAR
jgi:anti-sigma factor RsiW